MIIGNRGDVKKDEAQVAGCQGTAIQWLLGPKESVPHFHMRYVTVFVCCINKVDDGR
ncbi:MAG: hypothetical protein PVJ73_16415 [Acidobacteriota bacterium]|jgi:hypothetical protein